MLPVQMFVAKEICCVYKMDLIYRDVTFYLISVFCHLQK
jgi:hypothetical protein